MQGPKLNANKTSQTKRTADAYKLSFLHDARKVFLLVAAVLLLLILLIGVSRVDGVSMLDTYQDGDLVFYTRLNFSYNRGDVVSVRLTSGDYYIKRIVGIAGDVIDLRDGIVYVNGEAETASWVRTATEPESLTITYPFTVPEGDVFVLGDNRAESTDSRYFGSIGTDRIRGVIRLALPLH